MDKGEKVDNLQPMGKIIFEIGVEEKGRRERGKEEGRKEGKEGKEEGRKEGKEEGRGSGRGRERKKKRKKDGKGRGRQHSVNNYRKCYLYYPHLLPGFL